MIQSQMMRLLEATEESNRAERGRSRTPECKSSREEVIREAEDLVSSMQERKSNSPTGSSLKAKTNRTIDRRNGKQRRTDLGENLATQTGTRTERCSRSI